MSRLRIAPIVEGHGEDAAVRTLLQRLWTELLGGEYVEVLKPIRTKRTKITEEAELDRTITYATLKLRPGAGDPGLVLLLLDAEEDLPCELAPRLLDQAKQLRGDVDISCVLANVEYETWFVAAAESLTEYLDLSEDRALPEAPESARQGKAWVQKRFRGIKYSPSVDQPAMTSAMDLARCRSRSPSFDKLCRELEARLRSA